MSNPTWGMLQKSATDNETIEQAIVRLIQVHDDDEESHLDTGQSLQSHKASEIIDHLAESIIYDKLARGSVDLFNFSMVKLQFFTCFESFDGWQNALTNCTARILGAQIKVLYPGTADINVYAIPISSTLYTQWAKNPMFQLGMQIRYNTNQTIYFGMGAYAPTGNVNFIGFKIVNATLYACQITYVGSTYTEYTSEITVAEIRDSRIYRCEYNATGNVCQFFINGVLEATISGHAPGEDSGVLFNFYLKREASEEKSIHPNYLLWSREI